MSFSYSSVFLHEDTGLSPPPCTGVTAPPFTPCIPSEGISPHLYQWRRETGSDLGNGV